MPKLEGIQEKYWGKYKIDKENDTTVYSDEEHVYIDKSDNTHFISVTTLIHSYSQEFDENFWSFYKALEALIDEETFKVLKKTLLATKKVNYRILGKFDVKLADFEQKREEIKAEYERKRNESCKRGTAIHAMFENSFYNKNKFDFGKFGYDDLSGSYTCEKNYYKLDLDRGVYPEFLISLTSKDKLLKVAGQIDLLIKDGNNITIIDWKGLDINTPIPTPNGFVLMRDLKEGDIVYDKDGRETKVLHKSEIHNNPCYKVTFDNNDSIVADIDHRWLVKRGENKEEVLTTKEIKTYMENHPVRRTGTIFRIYNPESIISEKSNLPLDPYVLGAWLGDGASACGSITQATSSPLWKEIKKRGFEISDNHVKDPNRAGIDSRTVYGLRTKLRELNLLDNKHIPDIYLFSSYKNRLDLLRGLMDTDGTYNKQRHRYVMGTSFDWQAEDLCKLLATFGIKATKLRVIKHCDGKEFPGWDVCFTTTKFNPFLIRNQEINLNVKCDNNSFRNIITVEEIDSVPTQCIEVDSPSHTYLCTNRFIVTHNTNKEIKKESYYNRSTKKHEMMKFPLNNLQDTNFWHYSLQLSTYAYLLQQINPEFNIKGLKLVHIDHDGKQYEYEVEYLKDDVIRMLNHYKKQLKIQAELDKDKPFII